MGGAAPEIMRTGVAKAQVAIDGQPYFGGVTVFLAVILPPANRAELQRLGRA